MLIREYELTPSALNNWIKQFNTTGSFKAKDNRTEEIKKYLKTVEIIMVQEK